MKEEEMTYKSETSPFWERIKSEYPNHWVIVENPVYKHDGNAIYGGRLLFASDKRNDITIELRKRESGSFAIRYTGKRPNRLMLFTL